MKRIIACLMAGILMLALVGCGTSGSSSAAAKKDYTQILHDARSDEDNKYQMIFTKARTASSPPSTATAPNTRLTSSPMRWPT